MTLAEHPLTPSAQPECERAEAALRKSEGRVLAKFRSRTTAF